jgi:hypothetical protein
MIKKTTKLCPILKKLRKINLNKNKACKMIRILKMLKTLFYKKKINLIKLIPRKNKKIMIFLKYMMILNKNLSNIMNNHLL